MGGHKFDQSVIKTQLKLAVSRIKLQKQKKDNSIKNQKREIAELLKAGKDESARIKVEGIIRDDFIIEAFDILELFCELILARLGVIQISKECPPDLVEAVCTLIYAGPRTDIKELLVVREQLASKFGKEFGANAMSNKDNCVNARVIHKLSVQTPENYLVYQYLNEIARGANLQELEPPQVEPPHIEPLHIENLGHTTIAPPSNGNVVSAGPPLNGFPSFPQPPMNIPQFPQPPMNQMQPMNQMPPSFNSNPVIPPPQQKQPPPMMSNSPGPSFPDVPIPSFNANNFNTLRFPAPPNPSFNESPTPQFQAPTSQFQPPPYRNSIPDFPQVPTFPSVPNDTRGNNDIPNFPSVPNNNTLRFPSPPDTLNFPTPPSNTSMHTNTTANIEFPSPPSDGGSKDNAVPDFDDLTARFEKLKKRDF